VNLPGACLHPSVWRAEAFRCLCPRPSTKVSQWQWKKRQERRKHYARAVVERWQKFSTHRRPRSRGRRTAKIYSAVDGHYLHLQTKFGENRCTQFRVIMVQTPPARPSAVRHRQDRLQYTASLCLARGVIRLYSTRHSSPRQEQNFYHDEEKKTFYNFYGSLIFSQTVAAESTEKLATKFMKIWVLGAS